MTFTRDSFGAVPESAFVSRTSSSGLCSRSIVLRSPPSSSSMTTSVGCPIDTTPSSVTTWYDCIPLETRWRAHVKSSHVQPAPRPYFPGQLWISKVHITQVITVHFLREMRDSFLMLRIGAPVAIYNSACCILYFVLTRMRFAEDETCGTHFMTDASLRKSKRSLAVACSFTVCKSSSDIFHFYFSAKQKCPHTNTTPIPKYPAEDWPSKTSVRGGVSWVNSSTSQRHQRMHPELDGGFRTLTATRSSSLSLVVKTPSNTMPNEPCPSSRISCTLSRSTSHSSGSYAVSTHKNTQSVTLSCCQAQAPPWKERCKG